jgi:hypothetical protein
MAQELLKHLGKPLLDQLGRTTWRARMGGLKDGSVEPRVRPTPCEPPSPHFSSVGF